MTGCERILARLERGPATAAELYSSTYCIVHSRIAELRKRGYEISCEHVGGTGADTYIYSLLSDGRAIPSAASITEQGEIPWRAGRPPLLGSAETQVDRVDDPPQVSSTPAAVQLRLVA